ISVAQRRTAALLLHARCRDVAPKDLPSARFATLEPQKLFMRECHRAMDVSKKLRTERGAKCVSWSSAPYPPTRCRWPAPARHLVPFLPLELAGASTQFANDVDMAPRFWEVIALFRLALVRGDQRSD